jgi:6,7-dimethyl-8-ribityllumazine synthase
MHLFSAVHLERMKPEISLVEKHFAAMCALPRTLHDVFLLAVLAHGHTIRVDKVADAAAVQAASQVLEVGIDVGFGIVGPTNMIFQGENVAEALAAFLASDSKRPSKF